MDYALVLSVMVIQQDSLHLQTIAFFVRPWEIYEKGETIELPSGIKTQQELRQKLYENILDEAMYIARGSEGAVSLDWVMNQPIFIRKKYYEDMKDEVAERNRMLESRKSKKPKGSRS